MIVRTLLCTLLVAYTARAVHGQGSAPVKLELPPQAASESTHLRLLPADPDLREGNAAVVLLRMPWEQTRFMEQVAPTLRELTDLPYDDGRIVNEFHFDSFQKQMRRAAYMRDADWHYPLGEEPMAMILLPDLQGMRLFVGYGMSLWVGQQIAKGNLDEAREGILVQLACARHIARTPLTINQLVAVALAGMALEKVELLLQRPDSPNLYWALAMLPDSLGDQHATMQWQAKLLTGSLPSLAPGIPPAGDAAWKQVAAEFSQYMVMLMGQGLSPEKGAALKAKMLEVARKDLVEQRQYTEQDFQAMSPEEIVMRWVFSETEYVNSQIELAFSQPPQQALSRLRALQERIATTMTRTGAPQASFMEKPLQTYAALRQFDRRVKLLQTIESIRDHAARHDGSLPAALADLALPAPNDPLTGQPFEYAMQDGVATLSMATPEGLDASASTRTAYEVRIK